MNKCEKDNIRLTKKKGKSNEMKTLAENRDENIKYYGKHIEVGEGER